MILPEKELIRTPVEEVFLNDMIADDTEFITMESKAADFLDDDYESDQGLFDDVDQVKVRGFLADDDLDIEDLIGDDDEDDIDWDEDDFFEDEYEEI